MNGQGHPPQAPPQAGTPEQMRLQAELLRDANEHLVLAAVRFQELEEAATEAHRQQLTFLARVAHELRNPLQPLRFAAELLGRLTDEKLLARMRAIVSGQVVHLARLIEDLLDGARAGTGKFSLERSTVDLSHVLGLAAESCLPAMRARHLVFESRLPPQPLLIDADPVRLAQIFGNLLQNAAKYTPEGGSVLLAMARRDAVAEVTVTDDGIGISAEALPHVFELFVQDPHAVRVARDGLGIGLAVVRELVEAHGGTVQAYSAGKDQGSQFVVELPLHVAG
ncbi:MAG: HAMP domain-containing sensor histidine kinase [Pseudomonadota bacterium]